MSEVITRLKTFSVDCICPKFSAVSSDSSILDPVRKGNVLINMKFTCKSILCNSTLDSISFLFGNFRANMLCNHAFVAEFFTCIW